MKTRIWLVTLAAVVALAISSPPWAMGRGGGRGGGGGGGRAGGGGGYRGGGGGRRDLPAALGRLSAFPAAADHRSAVRHRLAGQPRRRTGQPLGLRYPIALAAPGQGTSRLHGRMSVGATSAPATGQHSSRALVPTSARGALLREDAQQRCPARVRVAALVQGRALVRGRALGLGRASGRGRGLLIVLEPAKESPIDPASRSGLVPCPVWRGGGAGLAASRLPNQGARVQDRMANRPNSLEDRRSNLNDRMSQGRQDWQQNRGDRLDDRQDFRNENREDWQNWADSHHDHYGDWYHGSWNPGAGWGYMWNNYPVAAAVGLTAWGVNRIGYGWGYWGYSNPYYSNGGSSSYDYSQPLVVYADNPATTTAPAGTTPAYTASSSDPQPTDEGMAAFEAARNAFYVGDYATALSKLDVTLKTMPRDTVVHEFRSLVLFALKKYPESAAAAYAVLSAGPGWDWTTMISLYPGVDSYTNQLRALEAFSDANPKSTDAHFLLGYLYMTMGYGEASAKQFKLTQKLLPNDKLIRQLVGMTAAPDDTQIANTPPGPPAVPPGKVLKPEQLVGNWKASAPGASFQLSMAADGSFTWTYSRGKEKQSVKGVYAVDQDNLALETDDGGGTMLAEVDFNNPSQFNFKMIGDDPKAPGLDFRKG